jgi:hypothetical protein
MCFHRYFVEPDTTCPFGMLLCAFALVCPDHAAAVISSLLQLSMCLGRYLVALFPTTRFSTGPAIGIPDEYQSPEQNP